jgi:hypothetical protein
MIEQLISSLAPFSLGGVTDALRAPRARERGELPPLWDVAQSLHQCPKWHGQASLHLETRASATNAVTSSVRGLVGVFNTLAQQHAEASALLKRTQEAEGADKPQALWRELRSELLSHERAELAEVYPQLEQHFELRSAIQQHQTEAEDLEAAIERLDEIEPGSPDWKSELQALTDLVTEHAQWEQDDFFPRALEVIGSQAARAMDDRFRATKNATKASLE